MKAVANSGAARRRPSKTNSLVSNHQHTKGTADLTWSQNQAGPGLIHQSLHHAATNTIRQLSSNQSGSTIFLPNSISRPQQPPFCSLLQKSWHKLSSWVRAPASPHFPTSHETCCSGSVVFSRVSQWLPFDVNCLQAKLSGERSCSLVHLLVTTELPRPVEKMLWC